MVAVGNNRISMKEMNRVAIAFSTCDRVELTKRSIEPLLQPSKFDLHWIDGSKTEEGRMLAVSCPDVYPHPNVRGGSGPAIVYALTALLAATRDVPQTSPDPYQVPQYDYIGLVENDVLLHDGWFDDMMELFDKGTRDGLEVGAVSARCYEDRILMQRPDYAVMHNLGAGMIMFSRHAAELVLQNYRTVFTMENRLLFAQLSGIDIGATWAFRGGQYMLVADWNFDRVLAAHGLASLALTPSRCEMLDYDIALAGLKMADGKLPPSDEAFAIYRDRLQQIRQGTLQPGVNAPFYHDAQGYTVFPHQIPAIGGVYRGDWRVRDFQGFGPFCWKAAYPTAGEMLRNSTALYVPISGPCDFLVSGGAEGGKVRVEDEQSGYCAEPDLMPEGQQGNVMALSVPGSAGYRDIRLTAMTPGVCFFGIRTREMQPWQPQVRFAHSTLPPP